MKRRAVGLPLAALAFSLTLVTPVSGAQAATVDPSNPLYAGIQCAVSQDVSQKFTNTSLSQYLFGYNYDTGNLEVFPNTAPINESTYVVEEFSGTLVNDGTLKAGDTFTYQLDPAARLGGFLSAESVVVNDLTVTDASGVKHVLATAHYDAATNLVTYTLTSFIEGKESVEVKNTESFLVKPDVVPYNGSRTFTDTFAGTTNTFTYNVDYSGNTTVVRPGNTFSFFSAILEANRNDKTYTQIFYLNPRGSEFPDGWTGDYTSPRGVTPLAADAEVRVYKLPADYAFPDTFGVDFAALAANEVTSTAVTTPGHIEVAGPTSDRYVIFLKNSYISNTTTDQNGNQVETINTLDSGFNVVASGAANTANHVSNNLILEQTYAVSGSTDASTLDPSVCEEPRTVTVTKTDAKTGAALANAVFEVRQNGAAVATLTTDASGKAVSAQLPFGDYELVEVNAPEGYQLDATPKPFTLSTTSPVFTYATAVTNTATPATPTPEPEEPTTPAPNEPTTPTPDEPTAPATPEPTTPSTSLPVNPTHVVTPTQVKASSPQKLARTGSEASTLMLLAATASTVGAGMVLGVRRARRAH